MEKEKLKIQSILAEAQKAIQAESWTWPTGEDGEYSPEQQAAYEAKWREMRWAWSAVGGDASPEKPTVANILKQVKE
jgi:hypothetical protein